MDTNKVLTRSKSKTLGPEATLLIPEDHDTVRISWTTAADNQAFQPLLDHQALAAWKADQNQRNGPQEAQNIENQHKYLSLYFDTKDLKELSPNGPNWFAIWEYLISLSGSHPQRWEGIWRSNWLGTHLPDLTALDRQALRYMVLNLNRHLEGDVRLNYTELIREYDDRAAERVQNLSNPARTFLNNL